MSGISRTSPFARFEAPTLLTDYKDSRLTKSVSQVAIEFFATKDFPKIFNYVIQWIARFTEISPQVKSFGVFAGNVKNFYSFTRVSNSCAEVASAVDKFWKKCFDSEATRSERGAAFRHVVRKFSDLSNDVCDSIKLFGQFFPLDTKVARGVDVVSAGFTFVGSAVNLADDSIKVQNARTTNEKILHGLSIGMDISYLIVGALGIAAFIISAPISIILVPLTTALVCSISSFFFRNLADPEGKNRNPGEVLEALKWQLQLPRPPEPVVVA